jgi:hypothetical protein
MSASSQNVAYGQTGLKSMFKLRWTKGANKRNSIAGVKACGKKLYVEL